jgi:hypothetical protein
MEYIIRTKYESRRRALDDPFPSDPSVLEGGPSAEKAATVSPPAPIPCLHAQTSRILAAIVSVGQLENQLTANLSQNPTLSQRLDPIWAVVFLGADGPRAADTFQTCLKWKHLLLWRCAAYNAWLQ